MSFLRQAQDKLQTDKDAQIKKEPAAESASSSIRNTTSSPWHCDTEKSNYMKKVIGLIFKFLLLS